jgi:excisionase family DNA binding protein
MDEHMDEGARSYDREPEGTGQDEVLTAREAATLLRVSADLVYEAANRGDIPHRRLGRRMLFSRRALLVWLRAAAQLEATRPGRRRSTQRRKVASVEAIQGDLEALVAVG